MNKQFNFKIVKNPYFIPYYQKDFKKITNTSLIIIWRNSKTGEHKYLIQKRSNKVRSGKNKLAFCGGMLEDSDINLQYGALRELIEESQIQFKKKKNLSEKTLKGLQKYVFPLAIKQTNFTFYMIIVSHKQPKFFGPIDHGSIKPFLKSTREVDLDDNKWNDKALKGKIKNGHAFLTKKEILRHYNKKPEIWRYSKMSIRDIFPIFEK